MSQENADIVRGAYEAFNRGDIEAVVANYDAEIEWIEPGGGSAPSGTFTGVDAVKEQVFGPVQENFDEFSVEVEDIKDEGDKVIVTGRFKGKTKSEAELDASFEHVNEMRDGKLVRFENKVEGEAWAKGWS
jgi:uncharacterized protein